MKKVIKRVLLVFGVLLLVLVSAIIYFTGPSGDILDYRSYFVDHSGPISDNQVKVTFFGVSTLLFDDGETQILIDGFFSRHSIYNSLFAELESDTARIDELVTTYKMDRVKGIFTTHSHYDHAFDVAYVTKKTGATLFGSESTLNIGRGGGLQEPQLELFRPRQPIQFGKFTMQVIPSIHSQGNALDDDAVVIDKPLSQPAGLKMYSEGGSFDFYILHNGRSIYVKPSPNFVEGALDNIRADILFLGIATANKYEISWQDQFYTETVGTLKPRVLIPIHWDDFFHPVSENLVMLPRFANDTSKDFDLFIKKTKSDKIDFKILQGTKSIMLFNE